MRHLSGLLGNEALTPSAYSDKVWNDDYVVHGNQVIERPHQNNGHPYLHEAYLGGKLYFCGTETSNEFAGYMEGAVKSAIRIAENF